MELRSGKLLKNYVIYLPGKDDDRDRRRKLLNTMTLVGVIFVLLTFFIMLILTLANRKPQMTEVKQVFIAGLIMLLSAPLILYLNNTRVDSIASIVFILDVIIIVLVSHTPVEITNKSGMLYLAIPIILSSVIFRSWASYVCAVVVCIIVSVVAATYGLFPSVFGMLAFFIVATISWMFAASLSRTIEHLLKKEREMLRSQAALSESEETSQALINVPTDSMILLDKEGTIIDINKTAAKKFGKGRMALIGANAYDIYKGSQIKIKQDIIDRVFRSRKTVRYQNSYAGTNMDFVIYPVHGFKGCINKVALVGRDITEMKQAENERARLISELEVKYSELTHANQAKDEFLANMSHELRTPLNNIMGSLKLLMDDLYETPEEKDEFIRTAYKNSKTLRTLINDILTLAQIQSGHENVVVESIDSSILFDDLELMYSSEISKKNLKLITKNPKIKNLVIRSDRKKLTQILSNLIDNSIKFTEKGTITVGLKIYKEEYEFFVTDTGIGIDLSSGKNPFQPFVQLDGSSTRKYGGTGMGLAIAKGLVELMEGTILMESEGPGHGTIVTVTLPRKRSMDE